MDVKEILTQYGPMRVAINLGNAMLAERNSEQEKPYGISIKLAESMAEKLGIALVFHCYHSARDVVAGAERGDWDIAFLAHDPARSEHILFSDPYLYIEGGYLVHNDHPAQCNNDLDREGIRIAVGKGAAYDLFLSRHLKQARLERAATTPKAVDLFVDAKLDAAAGVKGPLEQFAKERPEFRVLPEAFMRIEQTMALPKMHQQAFPFLQDFITTLRDHGAIADFITHFGKDQAKVA